MHPTGVTGSINPLSVSQIPAPPDLAANLPHHHPWGQICCHKPPWWYYCHPLVSLREALALIDVLGVCPFPTPLKVDLVSLVPVQTDPSTQGERRQSFPLGILWHSCQCWQTG